MPDEAHNIHLRSNALRRPLPVAGEKGHQFEPQVGGTRPGRRRCRECQREYNARRKAAYV